MQGHHTRQSPGFLHLLENGGSQAWPPIGITFGFPCWRGRPGFDPWVGKIPWRRQWHPTPVLLPGKSHRWRSLVGYSPWGHKESDTTERLHFHFSLPCIGEGNGNPLQCSCLENPRDGGAWWAAVYGVAQSWTRLKRLSSSSSAKLTAGAEMLSTNLSC